MVFSSLFFLYAFFPLNIILYFISKNTTYRNLLLLGFSLFFYAWGEPFFITVLLLSAVINYYLALLIHKCKNSSKSRIFLFTAVFIDLGILGFFKYFNFFAENINFVFNTGIGLSSIGLPVGISFYTFKNISYVADVYRQEVPPQEKLYKYLLYLSLYHQLMAGPIVRYKDIENEIDNRVIEPSSVSYGINRFVIGLFKKAMIANTAGDIASVFLDGSLSEVSVLGAWLGITMYTIQIYFDFSGYSDMAIGLGRIFGFTYKENFNYPYIAKNVKDFWRRWHISLSSFFRDYVYIPLGGNRKHYGRNLFIVWFLTGFWHGASWNFIVWGLYYCAFLLLEKKVISKAISRLPVFVSHIYLILVVAIGWVFFYFMDLSKAVQFIGILFGAGPNPVYDLKFEVQFLNNVVFLIFSVLASTPVFKTAYQKIANTFETDTHVKIIHAVVNGAILVLCTIMLVGKTYSPFLYFKF